MNWLISQLDMVVQQIAAIPRRLWPMGTWANRPDPATFPFAFYFATDVAGGALFRSTGVRWVPVSGALPLGEQNTDVTVGATTADTVVHSVAVPAGLVGPTDTIELALKVTRVASAATRIKGFFGGSGTDGALACTRTDSASANGFIKVVFSVQNRNAINSQVGDPTGALGAFNVSGAYVAVDFDAAQTLYAVLKKDAAGDTLVANTVTWRLIRGAT